MLPVAYCRIWRQRRERGGGDDDRDDDVAVAAAVDGRGIVRRHRPSSPTVVDRWSWSSWLFRRRRRRHRRHPIIGVVVIAIVVAAEGLQVNVNLFWINSAIFHRHIEELCHIAKIAATARDARL